MSFRAQVGSAVILGGGTLLIGALKVVFGSGSGASPFLTMGLAVLLVGGPLRLWIRRAWLSGARSARSDPAARLLAGPLGGVWRGWLWLTPEGQARD